MDSSRLVLRTITRVSKLNAKALQWLAGMTGLMLVIIAMMTGIRGLLPPLP
jgi:hypothetical protein